MSIWESPVVEKIEKKTRDFYNHKFSFLAFILPILTISIIEITLFSLGIISINDTLINDEKLKVSIVWFSILITTISSVFSFIGVVYNARFSKKFFPYLLLSNVLTLVNAVILKFYMTAFTFGIGTIIAIVRYFQWNKQGNSIQTTVNKKNLMLVTIISLIFFILGLLIITTILKNTPIYFEHPSIKYLDLMNATLIVTGMMLVNLKSKWAYCFFSASKIFSITMYSFVGQFIVITQILIFSTVDITTFIAWSYREKVKIW